MMPNSAAKNRERQSPNDGAPNLPLCLRRLLMQIQKDILSSKYDSRMKVFRFKNIVFWESFIFLINHSAENISLSLGIGLKLTRDFSNNYSVLSSNSLFSSGTVSSTWCITSIVAVSSILPPSRLYSSRNLFLSSLYFIFYSIRTETLALVSFSSFEIC